MTRNTILVIGMLVAFGTICLVLSNLCTTVPISETVTPNPISEFKNLRFQEVETFIFGKARHGTSTAVIYEDTKTGIKYLYIWKGAASGGPCITRLWEK